jgi:chloramphenicol-sensitive protein RarD
VLWGVFPLYFRLLKRAGAVEIIAHRVLWSLAVCAVLIRLQRGQGTVRAALSNRRSAALLAAAAILIAGNWGVYVYAVNSGHVLEASLGYFVNPLVTVLLGVLVLRERLRAGQWVAVGIGGVAVAVLTLDYGRPPWIALTLATSFAMYGLCKNLVGSTVAAVTGLTVETLLLAVPALVTLAVLGTSGRASFTDNAPWQGLLLVSTGAVTVGPLLLFAGAARRVPLTTIGLLQYASPVMQLLLGVLVLGEHMPASRWVGFGLVWCALAVLTFDSLRSTSLALGTITARGEATKPAAPTVSGGPEVPVPAR